MSTVAEESEPDEITLTKYESYEPYRDDPVVAERVTVVRDVLIEVVRTMAEPIGKVALKKRVGSAYYPLVLKFDNETPEEKPIVLSLISPGPAPANRWDFRVMDVKAGVIAQVRRVHELLYEKDALTLPIRWADYTYVYDYRPYGGTNHSEATNGQQDFLLSLLAQSETRTGQQLTDLVPHLAEVVPDIVPDGGILATPLRLSDARKS